MCIIREREGEREGERWKRVVESRGRSRREWSVLHYMV